MPISITLKVAGTKKENGVQIALAQDDNPVGQWGGKNGYKFNETINNIEPGKITVTVTFGAGKPVAVITVLLAVRTMVLCGGIRLLLSSRVAEQLGALSEKPGPN